MLFLAAVSDQRLQHETGRLDLAEIRAAVEDLDVAEPTEGDGRTGRGSLEESGGR